jgi:NAD-dependent deacetylase
MISELYNLWEQAPENKRIVVLTGAGISVQSGLSTYQNVTEKDNFWHSSFSDAILDYDNLVLNIDNLWSWVNEKRTQLNKIIPNQAHYSLVEMERFFGENFCLITQNIDNLHHEAGSYRLIEMRGNLAKEKMLEMVSVFGSVNADEVPTDARGNLLRPDILLTGEVMDKKRYLQTRLMAQQCDIMILVGTSLKFKPAADLPEIAKRRNHAQIIEINPEKQYFEDTDLYLKANAENILPFLINSLIDMEKYSENSAAQ